MPKRQVFYSFHFDKDAWRAGQVRNIGVLEGNTPVSSNEWEEVKRKGDTAIQNWIDSVMNYRSCVIVLIGEDTANRRWCLYEIERAWKKGKGIVGIYIHGLKDIFGQTCKMGNNPFDKFYIDTTFNYIAQRSSQLDFNEIRLSNVCHAHYPIGKDSKDIYSYISSNIESWVEEAIIIRNKYPK